MKGTFTFRGEKWSYVALPKEEFDAVHGAGADAACNKEMRLIHFREGEVKKNHIVHELFHMFCATLYTTSSENADLTIEQYEEIQADTMDTFYDDFNKLVNRLTRRLVK